MLSIAKRYLDEYGDQTVAAQAFAAGLMAGDPATFKAGYTRDNAVIATADAFDLPRETVENLIPQTDLAGA